MVFVRRTLTEHNTGTFTYQHFRLVYFFSDLVDAGLLAVMNCEVICTSRDVKQEVA